MDCERLREEGAELALGILPARERAEAVAHLDGCPECRSYVERLTAVGDGLLGLLPGAEPPVGFESRVVRAMAPGAVSPAPPARHAAAPAAARRRIRVRRFRIAAAGVAAALAFGFGGWAVGTVVEGAPAVVAPAPRVLEAALVSPDGSGGGGGREVGRIYAHPADATGGNGWVYMSVDLGGGRTADGPVRCVLVRADGSAVPLGSFSVRAGYGYWGAPTSVDPATLRGARLLAADGTLLATAHFAGAGSAAAGAAPAR
ncbi:anti-sigma factor family protein [Streptomyces sp. NPDC057540]|uniref:anti-sigma factor family protein n=1 Tax=Streptomyces sp. NPDC057540 TaxID=3346160 RepID=UPI0036832519